MIHVDRKTIRVNMPMDKSCSAANRFALNALIRGLAVGFGLCLALGAHAQMSQRAEALDLIAEFADRFCKEVQLTGRGVEVSGAAELELKGIFNRFADAGVKAQASYDSYEGLLRQDLLEALRDNKDCRITVWNDLNNKLLPDAFSTTAASATTARMARKLPYVIFNTWGDPVFAHGHFDTDAECLGVLLRQQARLGRDNAERCSRAPAQVWCLSYTDRDNQLVHRQCATGQDECEKNLVLHELEADIGDQRVFTSCENYTTTTLLDG